MLDETKGVPNWTGSVSPNLWVQFKAMSLLGLLSVALLAGDVVWKITPEETAVTKYCGNAD